ncbi:pre-mRNA-splicing factor cwc-21-like isoform X2 [Panicum virgatum]|uniref:pre-mRNA-splicing factor cwc-21-like isoform X2 n=1 Tax=Panicum virgatum TaxID=38727 RepID=UPI0019D64CE9|nr:pre-mRNA-splicing factor cwc-21-like isoform X2 [Panicum virgatum]
MRGSAATRQCVGSGTTGHVQASSSAAGGGGTPDPQHTVSSLDGTLKLDKDILEHDWKPQVELWLLMLRDVLEEQGYSEAEIDVRVKEEPKAAETEAAADEGRPRAQGEGHQRQLGVRPAQALAHNSVGRTEQNANTCISLFLRFLRKQPSTFSVTLPAHRSKNIFNALLN